MAFHINTHDLPPLRGYSDALNYWGKTDPWRGSGDTNTRPLAGRNKKHMTIRMTNSDAIAMRLHGTDVVVYHPDGTIVLNAYQSISTDMFARRLTPSGICTTFNNPVGFLLHLERDNTTMTFLLARDSVRLMRADNGDWLPVDPAMFAPFIKYRVDTAKANAVLKAYGFNDFKAWVKARAAMGQPQMRQGYLRDPKYSNGWVQTIELFRDGPDGWNAIFDDYHDRAADAVRDAIYRIENCIIKVEVPSIAGFDVSSVRASANKWRRLSNQF